MFSGVEGTFARSRLRTFRRPSATALMGRSSVSSRATHHDALHGGRRWPSRLLRGLALVPLVFHFTVAVLLLGLSYRYYYVNEDGEAGIYGNAVGIWVLGSAVIWIVAAAVLVGLWRWRHNVVVWAVPPAWFMSTTAWHDYVVRNF